MRLNLNDTIKVKLTEHGKDIYYNQYDRTNAVLGRELCKPSYPLVDDDGYTTFQLWRFMELYGDHMGMTLPNVIEPLDIVFDAPTIDHVRKGKWMTSYLDQEAMGVRPKLLYCSKCCHCIAYPTNYCPNCGAKME
jgi:hypothetical protein